MTVYHFAVIGNPIDHSLSPWIHQRFAEQTGISICYEKIQGDSTHFELQVADFFLQGGSGINITLPFKPRAFRMAQITTPRCAQAKAANVLWMRENNLHADNTDGIGLLRDLSHYIDLTEKNVLILGAGGAAQGIIGPLLDTPIACLTIANRTLEKALLLQQNFPSIQCINLSELNNDYDLIINATSVGRIEKIFTLSPNILHSQTFCYDLNYQKRGPTLFVEWAQKQNCQATDGLGMLIAQAAEAFYLWHGVMPEIMPLLKKLRHS